MAFFLRLPEELWLKIMKQLSCMDIVTLGDLDSNFWRLRKDRSLPRVMQLISNGNQGGRMVNIVGDGFTFDINEGVFDMKVQGNLEPIEDVLLSDFWVNQNQEIKHVKITNGKIDNMRKFLRSLPKTEFPRLEFLKCQLPLNCLRVISCYLPVGIKVERDRLHGTTESHYPTLPYFKIESDQPGYLEDTLGLDGVYVMRLWQPKPVDFRVVSRDCGVEVFSRSWETEDDEEDVPFVMARSWLSVFTDDMGKLSASHSRGLEWERTPEGRHVFTMYIDGGLDHWSRQQH